MKLLCACLATLVTIAAPFHTARSAEKPEPSKLSVYAGKYTGSLSYAGLLSGPAAGVFKASPTKEKGSYKVASTLSTPEGFQLTVNESFTFNGKKLVYAIDIGSPGLGQTASGSGTGKVTARKQGLNFTANIMLAGPTGSVPATVSGVFLPRQKTMRVTTQLSVPNSQGVALIYQLKKKGR